MKFQTLSNLMLHDSTTLAHVVQSYAHARHLLNGKQLHAHLLRAGYPLCTYLTNHLLSMYAKCGHPTYALNLFERMPQRNLVSWTAMISGYSQNLEFTKAVTTFCEMRGSGERPNQFAFSSVIQACASLGSVMLGRQMHSLAVKSWFNCELFVGSNLADMYSKCGSMVEACMVFEEMECKDVVSWTALINGYVKTGDFEEALKAFNKMLCEDIIVDKYVLCSTLGACGALKAYGVGTCFHSFIVRLGFEMHVYVCNALTNMYCKVGDMESGSRVSQFSSEGRSIVSCTSLIDGYVEADQIEKALSVFLELKRQRIEPNEYTFSSLVKACANHAALEQGAQIHAQVIKYELDQDPFVSSTLVDMYGKCGLIDYSIQAFEKINRPTDIAWNSLVGMFSQHGLGKEAIKILDRMIIQGIKPNAVTFVNLLTGCSHAGLVDEGLHYFNSMEKNYGIAPRSEHYSCVVDLLGRAGRLKEAEEFINNMPFEPNAYAWCSLLGACRMYGDKERGELAAQHLKKLEPENSGAHVLLSNIYAKERKWDDVKNIRKMMRDRNVKKLPGYSWVHFGKKTHVFEAEDWSHPQKREIDAKLDSLLEEIKEAGYVPDTSSVTLDLDDSVKVKLLHRHSERIAIAFALISMPLEKPIIVKKNIRVCVDCHSAIKFISKVEGRKIILRDNSRFHLFVDGSCSCGDYW